MARAIWTGSVSFGLVNVPVGLYSATEDHDVHFHQFEKGTSSRVRNERVNEDTGDEVAYKDIVKGAELSDGGYVMLTPEELESVEPGTQPHDRHLRLRRRRGDRPDLLPEVLLPGPVRRRRQEGVHAAAQGDGQGRAHRGRDVRHARQAVPRGHPTIRQRAGAGDHVLRRRGAGPRRASSTGCPSGPRSTGKDLDMAVSLVKAMTSPWKPKNYRDTYTERVQKLIDAKKKNREIVVPEEIEEDDGPRSSTCSTRCRRPSTRPRATSRATLAT